MRLPLCNWLACTLSLACLFATSTAFAGLGDKDDAVSSDARLFKGISTVEQQTALFRKHKIDLSGRLVHEYARNDKTIFAVSWSGHAPPELNVLLSAYFAEYRAAVSSLRKVRGRAPVHIDTPNMTVDMSYVGGRQVGRAILKTAVPEGLDLKSVQ